MHPPSSSVRILQAKVTICQQKFVPFFIRRVHHVPFTSLTMSGLKTRSPCVARSLDTHVGLNVATRFLLPCLESVQTVVLCRFWLQCSRSLRHEHDVLSESHFGSPWIDSTARYTDEFFMFRVDGGKKAEYSRIVNWSDVFIMTIILYIVLILTCLKYQQPEFLHI
jgi:hypothetical protein